ncbi:hypothetical protein JCM14036_14920 [Desulfotomaculum defluvii]
MELGLLLKNIALEIIAGLSASYLFFFIYSRFNPNVKITKTKVLLLAMLWVTLRLIQWFTNN